MKLPGLNIQVPWAELIVDGVKTIETRHYPIPKKYLNKDILIVETPGKSKAFPARVVGVIKFKECFQYISKNQFDEDIAKHHVHQTSEFYWSPSKQNKWAWVISNVVKFETPFMAPKKRGILWTCEISMPPLDS